MTHLSVTVSPLAAAANGSEGAICLFSDLTPVIELEEQLRLKEALARVGELTAGIAHEFRKRAGDDSWLQPPHSSRRSAAHLPAVRRRHPSGDGGAGAGGHQLPAFCAARIGRVRHRGVSSR